MNSPRVIDLQSLYTDTATLTDLPTYIAKALELAGEGNEVVLTGQAPVWLYLEIAHTLHGKTRKLIYRSPVSGDVVIFDHDPGPGGGRREGVKIERRKA
jgi:hypothetical protein